MVRPEAAEHFQFMAPLVTLSFVPRTPKPKEIPKVPFFRVGRVKQLKYLPPNKCLLEVAQLPKLGPQIRHRHFPH